MFDYQAAFSRNIGWVTEEEQTKLRQSCVAIGGMGGVGGVHLLTLARMGIGRFKIAEFDEFEIANFNRQVGATVSTIGRKKIEVLKEMALDINPEIEIELLPHGIQPSNIASFLQDVDVYVDGLDFFAFDARRLTFSSCEALGVPVVTAAPLGLGVATLVFAPGGMPFEDYFGFEGCDELEMAIRFLVGLSPAMLQRGYVADMSRVNLQAHKGPSSIAACQLCAGVAAIEAMKLLLGRGALKLAPWGNQFDAYRMRFKRTWRPGGFRNPLQRLMCLLVRRQLAQISRGSRV